MAFDGAGYARLDFGCPLSVPDEGLSRILRAMEEQSA